MPTVGTNHILMLFKVDNSSSIRVMTDLVAFFPTSIIEEQNESLQEQVTLGELNATIHSMKVDKISGLDGIPIELYKGHLGS